MKRLFVISAAFLLTTAAFGFEMTPKQEQVLLDASQNGFQVNFVDVNACGTWHSVTILGETHFKTKGAGESGNRVLAEYNFRGVEAPVLEDAGRLGYILVPVSKGVQKVAPMLGLHGSTIRDARKQGLFFHSDGNVLLNGEPIGKMMNGPSVPTLQRPSGLPVAESVAFAHQKIDQNISHFERYSNSSNLDVSKVSTLNIGIEYGKIENWEHKVYEEVDVPLISARNRRFAANIIQSLCTFSEQKTMLVIVGKAHSDGLTAILQEREINNFDRGL